MDLATGLDAFERHYFVLDGAHGMRIFKDLASFRRDEVERSIPASAIGKATRGAGLARGCTARAVALRARALPRAALISQARQLPELFRPLGRRIS